VLAQPGVWGASRVLIGLPATSRRPAVWWEETVPGETAAGLTAGGGVIATNRVAKTATAIGGKGDGLMVNQPDA